MNGAGIEELNHEIYGGLYSQLIHGESFEEPAGRESGVSGGHFTNPSHDDGNSSYITWQLLGANNGCKFSVSSTALNGNQSQQVGCGDETDTCDCGIVNRGGA